MEKFNISKKELFDKIADSVFKDISKASSNLDRLNNAIVDNAFSIERNDNSFMLAVNIDANTPEISGAIVAEAIFKTGETEDGTIEIDTIASVVTNTNEGFVYLDVDDKNRIVAAAPVINPCIFGTMECPTGIYIPLNPYSMEIGKAFVNKFTSKCSSCPENNRDLPKAPFEEDNCDNTIDNYRVLHL